LQLTTTIALIAVAVSTAGCASVSYIMDNYSGVQVKEITTSYDTFRVFDKPSENRMMITSSIASAAGQGIVGGLLLNPAAGATPLPVFREAVEKYLAQSGRICQVKDGTLLAVPQWEFRYSCDPEKIAMQ
jgi:hypothetical protein